MRKFKSDKCNVAMVTTASKKNTHELLSFFNLNNYFDLILTQEDVQQHKPDPQGFVMAMDFFGVTGYETVVFEDSNVGYEAAKICGTHCFLYMNYK